MSKKILCSPLTWAIILAMAYTFWLAPISGGLGGLCFLLTAWAVPTIINFLITAWLVGLLRIRRTAKLLIAVPISFLLGVNVYLPRYAEDLIIPRSESVFIVHPIQYTAQTPMDIRLRSRPSVSANPIEAPVQLDGDEGCGCFYFSPRSPSWFDQTSSLIDHFATRALVLQRLYELFPSDLTPGVHFDVVVEPDPRQANRAKFILDVFDGTQRVATFAQNGIYFDQDINQRTGREKRIGTEWFAPNVGDLLLHDNVWSRFAPQAARQLSEDDLEKFLSSVLQRHDQT